MILELKTIGCRMRCIQRRGERVKKKKKACKGNVCTYLYVCDDHQRKHT